jgi:hypothetical protein
MLFSKPKPVQKETQYYPLEIGLPKGLARVPRLYEFFVVGTRRGEEDGLEKVLQILQDHGGRLISITSFPDGDHSPNDYVCSCTVDTSKLDCNTDDLLIMLRKTKSVRRAEKTKVGNNAFSDLKIR